MSDIYATAVVITNSKRQILLAGRKEAPGQYGLPGGKVEPGEHPVIAAAREVFEETGIYVVPWRLVPVFDGPSVRTGRTVRSFVALEWMGEPQNREAGVDVKWGSWDDLAAGPFAAYHEKLRQKLTGVGG
jgi:8-oxo-dGTP pyrophosphatase MutT (NUDIX family)